MGLIDILRGKPSRLDEELKKLKNSSNALKKKLDVDLCAHSLDYDRCKRDLIDLLAVVHKSKEGTED